jgi:hypothetical protein
MNILLEANLDNVQDINPEEEKGAHAYVLLLKCRTKL